MISSSLTADIHFRSAESSLLPSREGQLCHHLSHGNWKVWPVHCFLAGDESLIKRRSHSLIKSLFLPDIMCAVSAAAGWLSRHTRDSLECWQLGTGKGGKHFQMKMYKKCFIPQRTFYSSERSLGVLQLAPSIDHQISAMFSILERYPEIFN